MIFAIYKKFQLFWFGFSVSASALVYAGMSAGSFTYQDIQTGMSDMTADYLAENPDAASGISGYVRSLMSQENAALVEPAQGSRLPVILN
ncbi:hypothetical protein [Litoreibacter roseus]|uniref:Uncharacterized protein n=1 Tax=Litoreibacter roseus TaxID=2601869 RepID=A0A6N6JH77_9RHOB|nr:hypothetical protein [Litoreibacter roseus]GFE65200.1 hypothetical protein KIN_22740 [Litoreibacter roseus]